MRHARPLLLLFATAASVSATAQGQAPPMPPLSADECAVFRAEQAFARSVEQADREAFAAAIHPEAVFSGAGPALKGRDAVVAGWAAVFDPAKPQLRWHPESVAIGDRTDLAISRGPYWITDARPDAPHPLLAGEFTSIWARGEDGRWQVLFDGGSTPAPITPETLAKRRAAIPAPCD